MKRLVGMAMVAASLLLLVSGVPATLAAPAHPGASAAGPNYTHHSQELLPMSDALCAQYRAAVPSRAADPNLCFFVHGMDWTDVEANAPTDMPPSVQAAQGKAAPGMAAALACYSGHVSYHDWLQDPLRWSVDMDTTWYWYGDCAVPSNTRRVCWVDWTVSADYTNTSCYGYTYPATNPDRRAAVYTGIIHLYDGPITITYWETQRRECYKSGASSCYWTNWSS